MVITLDEYEQELVEQKAEEYGVGADDLAQCYKDVMNYNFEDDLCDAALENLHELQRDYHNGQL